MMNPTHADLELVEDGNYELTEALDVSKLGRSTIYLRMEDGSIPFMRIGRRRLIPKRGLMRFLAQHLVTGTR
jgi:excisionase family DNA binding protein